MRTKKILLTIFTLLLLQTSFAQGLQKPAEGKALVYITRVSSMGAAVNFKYFHNDQYIGKFNGGKYIVLECEPGEHLFWASSENEDFIPATLEPNKVYIIDARVKMGGMKARVNLIPVVKSDEKLFAKATKLINKKSPKEMDQAKVAEDAAKLQEFITKSLSAFETDNSKEWEVLEASMHHSE